MKNNKLIKRINRGCIKIFTISKYVLQSAQICSNFEAEGVLVGRWVVKKREIVQRRKVFCPEGFALKNQC